MGVISVNVYLAARYGRRDELRGLIPELNALGYGVSVRWLLTDHDLPGIDKLEGMTKDYPVWLEYHKTAKKFATEDIEDLSNAHIVVFFTEGPNVEGRARGGRHVELGLAIAWKKPRIIVGPLENVFTTIVDYQCDSWSEAKAYLAGFAKARGH